jgi:pimeloyl-ACP methyl ester carboxylesterase
VDEYTENLARYPNAERFDFVGHSNGTYLLSSALQSYRTLMIGRVYFAGSVAPNHYPWRPLLDEGRVERVVNVVAASDWVVALFPKLFEQLATWTDDLSAQGLLDIGSAGFRGFRAADDPQGRVINVQFAKGQHGVGVDAGDPAKIRAIVDYILDGEEKPLELFRQLDGPCWLLDGFSNVSWIVWIGLAAIVVVIGVGLYQWHWVAALVYAIVLLGILTSG